MLSLPLPLVEHGEWEGRRGAEPRKNNKQQQQQQIHQQPPIRGKCLVEMEQLLDSRPDAFQYAALLRQCGKARSLLQGMRVHAHLVRSKYGGDVVLNNLLVQMYGKCGSLQDARNAFDRMEAPNIFSWNIMLAAYAQNGHPKEALVLFEKMDLHCKPDRVTLVTMLGACSSLGALREGKLIHANVIANGLESNPLLASSLVNMYGKCGSVDDARCAFEKMHKRDVIAWNSMIAAYARNGYYREALDLYGKLFQDACDGPEPDAGTFVVALDVCGSLRSAADGRDVHSQMLLRDLQPNVVVYTAVLSMYGKCGCLEEARGVFNQMTRRNIVTWTALIEAYAQYGHHSEALELYKKMRAEDVKVDNVVLTIVLGACSCLKDFESGKEIHAELEASGLEVDSLVADALLELYASCDMLDVAKAWVRTQGRAVFWTALIAAYTQRGRTREAFEVYAEMPQSVTPDEKTFASILNTCSCIGAAAMVEGRSIHARISATGFDADVAVASALINMYSKCGSLQDARAVFDEIKRCNVVFWSTMIAAYAQQGHSQEVFSLLHEMCQLGLKPNRVTFVSILEAAGPPLDEGLWHFSSMVQDHGILPSYEHYARMVHLLTCIGNLEEAEELIRSMPFVPDARVWTSMLQGCRKHHRLELKKLAAEEMLQLGKQYAELGMWNQVMDLRTVIQQEMQDEIHHESVDGSKPRQDDPELTKEPSITNPVLRSPTHRPYHLVIS